MLIDKYPGIKAVALEIAYDNGMLNRLMTEEVWLASLDEVLGAEGIYEQDLIVLENWIQTLTLEQQYTLATGEETECLAVEALCPIPKLLGIFEDIFNH